MANFAVITFDLSAAATTTEWRRMLSQNQEGTRAIHGTLVSGDTVQLQFTNERLEAGGENMTSNAVTTNVAASPTQTAVNFELSYDGNFRWVRAVKTGANGVARIHVEA
jgi:hypothetical protein